MSRENIQREAVRYEDALRAGTISMATVLNNIREVCYAKPNVPEAKFLAACRKYDPKFAPVSSAKERRERAALSKQVQEGILKQTARELNVMPSGLTVEEREKLERHHRILFRGRKPEEKRQIADIIIRGDKKALGELYYQRVFSKKDELYAMLNMNDAQLAEHYFNYKDELDLIHELESYRDSCEFTEAQKRDMEEMFNAMGAMGGLSNRMDVIANPYYANFPCEQLEMSDLNSARLYEDMKALAQQYGERVAGSNEAQLGGPTGEFGKEYRALRGFAFNLLDQTLSDYVVSLGGKKDACIWATGNGKIGSSSDVIDLLNDHELIFVNIPGVGIKALHNTANGYKNCKPEEASPEVVHQHMLRAAEKGLNRVADANPFFLSVFTGSAQYKQMDAQHKAVKEMLQAQKPPLTREDVVKTERAIQDLRQSVDAYLDYKRSQGLREEDGKLIGRSADERKRIAAAQQALELSDALAFQLQYQSDDKAAANLLQTQQDQKNAKKFRAVKQPTTVTTTAYKEDELCKSSVEELQAKFQSYKTMPACKPSDAGPALERLQQGIPAALDQLAKFAGKNFRMGETYAKNAREQMAKVVLFDYVLRERNANGQDGNTVTAGTVETALNKRFSASVLAGSPEFVAAIGKVTPARIEAFLNHNEARNQKFDGIVQNALSPVKVNAPVNQVAQQPKIEMEPPKAESKPMVNPGP